MGPAYLGQITSQHDTGKDRGQTIRVPTDDVSRRGRGGGDSLGGHRLPGGLLLRRAEYALQLEWVKSSGGKSGGDSGRDSGDDSSDDDDSPFSHPISSDRPGFGDSPTTVGCGVCQLELGYQYTFDRDEFASHINHSYPQSLLRVGTLANWFELRVSWSMEQGNRPSVLHS